MLYARLIGNDLEYLVEIKGTSVRFSSTLQTEMELKSFTGAKAMRTTLCGQLSALVDQLPLSLQTAALSVPLRKADHDRLVAAVNTRWKDAVGWA
jgi:hypothetical protein